MKGPPMYVKIVVIQGIVYQRQLKVFYLLIIVYLRKKKAYNNSIQRACDGVYFSNKCQTVAFFWISWTVTLHKVGKKKLRENIFINLLNIIFWESLAPHSSTIFTCSFVLKVRVVKAKGLAPSIYNCTVSIPVKKSLFI